MLTRGRTETLANGQDLGLSATFHFSKLEADTAVQFQGVFLIDGTLDLLQCSGGCGSSSVTLVCLSFCECIWDRGSQN